MSTNVYQVIQRRDGLTEGQKVIKTLRGILNKLTPEKFENLMGQLDELKINDEETLNTFVELLVEKALLEQSYSGIYAKMCLHLKELSVSSSSTNDSVRFHRLLLIRCHKEFDKHELLRQKENDAFVGQEDLEQTTHKARVRLVGTVKFVGELFKLNMISACVMHTCIDKLLKDEDSLECMCRLLSIVGKGLDIEAERPKLNSYFDQICQLRKEQKVSNRMKFMLQDVVELRENNWVPCRKVDGPKTMKQFHKELQEEEEREELQLRNRRSTIYWRGSSRWASRGQSFNGREIPGTVNRDSSRDGVRKQPCHLGSSSSRGVSNSPVEHKSPPKQAASLSDPSHLKLNSKEQVQVQKCNEKEVYQALKGLLQKNCINDRIEEWIQNSLNARQRSTDSFVRALMRAVCESVIVDCGVHTLKTYELLQRVSLLKKHLKEDEKQLVALNILQQVVVQMDQPDGLPRMFFDVLFDEEVIQDEIFWKWKSSTASALSVCNFFTWLQEATRRIK